MWLMLAVLAGVCGGGCRDEQLVGPRGPLTPPGRVLVTADSLCVRAQLLITSPTAVQLTFPDTSDCGTSLTLRAGGVASWAQEPSRRLVIPVRLVNHGSAAVQLPVVLRLDSAGTTVVLPAGQPASKVVPLNADSTDAVGASLWLIGGNAVLAAGDSTVEDTLEFNVKYPVTKARWQFGATAQIADTGRPPIPASSRYAFDTLMVVQPPGDTATRYLRDVLVVSFDDTTSGATINALLQHFGAVIIAGSQPAQEYYLRIPDPGPSWQAFDQIQSAMNAWPGVVYAAPVSWRGPIGLDARYPEDGPGLNRAAWLAAATTPTPATWAFQAIRSPLAWSCENGRYGNSPIRLAVVDFFVDTSETDPKRLSGFTFEGVDTATANPSSNPFTVSPLLLSHGTDVSGLLSAVGDDSTGGVGQIWDSDLTFFGLVDSASNQVPGDWAGYLVDHILPTATARGIRVITLSITVAPTHPAVVARLRSGISRYVGAGGMIVASSGNDSNTITIPGFLALIHPHFGVKAALASFFSPGDPTSTRDGILIVMGTSPGNNKWPGSTDITGAVEVAAPAQGIQTLRNGGGQQAPSGTSLSAPLVAGVAAQLFAMDPTLTPAEVKDYILRGAREPLLDSVTGQPIPRQPVSGAPGTVYQLDAYGALSLLSRERPGTPICGFRVSLQGTPPNRYLWLERNAPEAISLPPQAGVLTYHSPSVAQGGRRLAITQFLGGSPISQVREYTLQGGSWTLTRTMPNQYRRAYLEKDTVDQVETDRGNGWYFGTTITGPGRSGLNGLDLSSQAVPVATYLGEYSAPAISPDGKFAIVHVAAVDPACPDSINEWSEAFLVPIGGGASQPLIPGANTCGFDYFAAHFSDAVWYPEGDRFLWAEGNTYTASSVLHPRRIVGGSLVSDGPDVGLTARLVVDFHDHAQRISPDGHRVIFVESLPTLYQCRVVTHSTTAGFPIIQEEPINNDCLAPITPLLRQGNTRLAQRFNGVLRR